jgi:hypothetical protein
VLPPGARHRIAADLQHLAHLQSRAHPAFRRSQRALTGLRNRHAGETCVIIGNGPSLKGFDLGALTGVTTFCLNRGYLLWAEQGLHPSYYVAINDLVIEQFHAEIARLGVPLFLPWQYQHLFAGNADAIFVEMRWHERFFTDVRHGLWPGTTVTFAAMQLAYYMGFRRVVLIGVDHRFKEAGPAHAEVVQQGDDQNHFAPSYFGKGVRWNLPDLAQSEVAYLLARETFGRDGREIIDATKGGALDVFPKMPLAQALAEAGTGS